MKNQKCSGCQKRRAIWQKAGSRFIYCDKCADGWRSIGTFLYRITS